MHSKILLHGDTTMRYTIDAFPGISALPYHRLNFSDSADNSRRTGRMPLLIISMCLVFLVCSGCSDSSDHDQATIVVNSLEDTEHPANGTMTLRAALEASNPGEVITFDPSLNGGTIELGIVGSSHTVLKGEVYSGMQYLGYQERDYGKSALYARKNVVIDASGLPDGITIKWGGTGGNRARVLAVYGNLTMRNVTVTSGYSQAEATGSTEQPYTLARGGGLAVWGTAALDHCTISGNTVSGDSESSRDRGTYGGGIYANGLVMRDCIVSGNSAIGYGAAGGGIYSVGGSDGTGIDSSLTACTVSGNRVTGQHAYGGGIFTLGGGPNNTMYMRLTNCTIATNLVEDNPDINPAPGPMVQYYYRGGGVYVGGGSLSVASCTIAENSVTGNAATFSGKPNMGGGGICATIGNAHVVEYMSVWHSIIAGNSVNGSGNDLYTGSLLHFYSYGYNLVGRIDFSQILVPVPAWGDLSRKHWPKTGDHEGVAASDVLSLDSAARHASIVSAGADAGQRAVLWYPPSGDAVDRIPAGKYEVESVLAEFDGYDQAPYDFLNMVLEKLRTDEWLGSDFGPGFGDMSGVTWHLSPATWPSDPLNAEWIAFWRDLDTAIGDTLGMVTLGDDFRGTFESGPLNGRITMRVIRGRHRTGLAGSDQLGNPRPSNLQGDIGAIEN